MLIKLAQPETYSSYPTVTPYGEDTGLLTHMGQALHQSLYRVLSLLISVLPGLLVFVVALGLLTGLGMLLSAILRRLLASARFDERLSHTSANSIADWSPGHSPTALAGRIAFWACVLLGLVIGISAVDASYSSGSPYAGTAQQLSLLPYLTRSVGALLLLFVGNLIARFLARTVLIGAVNNQLQYARFLSMGVKWLVLVLASAMALDHLQIGGAIVELAFGILFGGIVLTLALAIGLGSRDLVSRSLERTAERSPERQDRPTPIASAQGADRRETLRHF